MLLANPDLYTVLTSGCLPIETIADNGHITLIRVDKFQFESAQNSSKPYIEPRPGHTSSVSRALSRSKECEHVDDLLRTQAALATF